MKRVFSTRVLAYGAMVIALAFVLSFIRVVKLPNGGSVTLASMLPLIVFAFIAGPKAGMIAGLGYGMLQYVQEPYFVHWAQFLLDYPLAFAMLGAAGFYKRNIYIAAGIAGLGRLICHFISGVVFFAEYAEGNVYLYSLVYNGSYILPEIILGIVILLLPGMKQVISRAKSSLEQR